MSKTLTLVGAGWESVQSSAKHGRRADSIQRLRSLLAHPDLPMSVACKAHCLIGDLLVAGEQYAEARRHFRAAAGLAPTQAETFFQWGLAHERDPHGSDRHAAMRFRTASELEPKNQTYRAAFGRALVRCGRLKRGVCELLAAAQGATGDIEVIRVVVEGLIEARQVETARSIVNKARFQCFESVKERELIELQSRVRFESARCEQRGTTRHEQDAEFAKDGGRVVLPFVRIAKGKENLESGSQSTRRRDVVSMPQPHLGRLRACRAD
jgi:hypothetical protein